jgi:hypothetical protein
LERVISLKRSPHGCSTALDLLKALGVRHALQNANRSDADFGVTAVTVKGAAHSGPNDLKLSDGGGWRAGCAGEGGGAASVTAGAVRCSARLDAVGCDSK